MAYLEQFKQLTKPGEYIELIDKVKIEKIQRE